MQIGLHPVVPGRPTYLLQPCQLMLIGDVLFMTKIIWAPMASRTLFPAHFMVIVSISFLEFLDSLMFFWLVITELGRALN